MTLTDLKDLCDKYVPHAARHPNSIGVERGDAEWWDAHEIGHLLTVPRRAIREQMFGLVDGDEVARSADFQRGAAYELAAMDVSRRLLVACGRPDLVRDERKATDPYILSYGSLYRARQIMIRRGALRLPHDRDGLERRIQAVLS